MEEIKRNLTERSEFEHLGKLFFVVFLQPLVKLDFTMKEKQSDTVFIHISSTIWTDTWKEKLKPVAK